MKLTNTNDTNTVTHNRYNILTNHNDNDDMTHIVDVPKHKSCINQKRVRRGRHMKKDVKSKCSSYLKNFSTNGAGVIRGKQDSLRCEVSNTEANIVTVQEMHSTQKGRFQMPNFVVFEAIRKKKGGGTIIAIHEDLTPKLVEEYNEEFELLVVEVKTKEKDIRLISGYGPQENWDEEKRMPFFLALETEVEKAELAGKSLVIEMDANSKLGSKYIPKDPHDMSPNGALLAGIIERHNLVVANGTSKSVGIITRRRVTKRRVEESVIDIVAFSDDMVKHFVSFEVDEAKKHVLTKITKSKRGTRKKESDHNVLITEFDCKVSDHKKEEKEEFYNLKNKECQGKFKVYSSESKMLSSVFDSDDNLDDLVVRFVKKVNGCIAMNFKKTRITKQHDNEIEELYNKRRKLKFKDDAESKSDLETVELEIAEHTSKNMRIIKEELDKMKENEGGMNPNKLWKMKKRLCPNARDPPCAMLDRNGNLLTTNKAIEERAIEVYAERLSGNKMETRLKDLEKETNELCEIRTKLSKLNRTKPWTMEDLNDVLKKLEKDKSRDAEGFSNELFKEDAAGEDLVEAVLKLMNLIKERQQYPNIMEKCNITSLHKKNQRNIFQIIEESFE